jgi:ABC-type phosphate transport system substrate-binding protein
VIRQRVLVAGLAALVFAAAAWTCPASSTAGAATVAGTLSGEGGDAMTPVMVKLIHDDASSLSPDVASYTNVDLEQGIADFVGSAPGTFANDFAVTERPLTTAEAATAAANGRSFVYVPFVASPVALMTLVPNSTYTGTNAITPSQYCQNIPLSLDNLDGIYGAETSPTPQYSGWGDARLSCTAPPAAATPADSVLFGRWANLDPTMENDALMALLDSTPASQASFAAGLTAAHSTEAASTADPTASEHWPYSGTAVAGGDQATLGKLIGLDPRTGAPSSVATQISLGAIMPVASVWTGDPLGVRWDLPTAAVQNATGAYVPPSTTAAQAAEADATFATTSDPTTNNLVTSFNATGTDAATAYNNYLMMESYLVVPTNGLPADKALALAQFIRFAVGTKGQADIEALGAAPATSAMVAADLTVAQQLDAEAAAAPATTTTTTTTTAGSTTTTVVGSSTGTSSTSPSTSAGTSGSSSGGLALTGSDPIPLLGLGVVLLVCGEVARQIVRRRKGRA